jgi:hypothetical protein
VSIGIQEHQFGINKAVLKEPAYGLAVRLFPKLGTFFLAHLVALIQIGMTPKT